MSQEANYSYTLKTPKAGNLFTIRGDTAEETKANLDAAVSSGLLAAIAGIEASLRGEPQVPLTPGGHATGAVVPPADRPRPPADHPAQELPAGYGVKCETCQAPATFQQEGTSSKSGKHYRRYACSANALHKATFTN